MTHLYKKLPVIALAIASLGVFSNSVSAQRQIVAHPENYKDTGVASFYGKHFDGRLTSTGEIYDSKGMTAASNTLPLNTYVKVINLRNEKWVVLRINDRMAKHNKRLIDVTRGAATKLGIVKHGLSRVVVQTVPQAFYTFFGITPQELLTASDQINQEDASS